MEATPPQGGVAAKNFLLGRKGKAFPSIGRHSRKELSGGTAAKPGDAEDQSI
jgi:hypothetical protein